MGTVKTKIVPVIIGVLGTINKGLDKNVQLLPVTGRSQSCIRAH
jgi:hypothetical protein